MGVSRYSTVAKKLNRFAWGAVLLGVALFMWGCGMAGSSLTGNQGDVGTDVFANPQWNDVNALANGMTLVYGLDFQNTTTPLTDTLNPTKTLLWMDLSGNFTPQNGGAYNGWKKTTMRRLGANYTGYVSGNVTRVNAENYPTWTYNPTSLGRAASFPNGVNNQANLIEVPDVFAGQTLDSGSFFVEFWMKPTVYYANEVPLIYRWGHTPGSQSWAINFFHYNLAVYTSSNGSNYTRLSTGAESAIKFNSWSHVAVAFSPTQVKIYVNGALVKTFTSADSYFGLHNPTNVPLRIGQTYTTGFRSNHFQGKISALRIMNGVMVDNNSASLMRPSYGFQNKAAGVGPTNVSGFIDKSQGADRFFRLMSEDATYATNGYNYEFDYGLFYPTDKTLGISRDFLATVDFQLQNLGTNRYHALLTKGEGPGEPRVHFQIGVSVKNPTAYLHSASGTIVQLIKSTCLVDNSSWYRISLLVSGNMATLESKNLNTSVTCTATKNITAFNPDTSMGTISFGKSYGHSGASMGYIDNIKIYKR